MPSFMEIKKSTKKRGEKNWYEAYTVYVWCIKRDIKGKCYAIIKYAGAY